MSKFGEASAIECPASKVGSLASYVWNGSHRLDIRYNRQSAKYQNNHSSTIMQPKIVVIPCRDECQLFLRGNDCIDFLYTRSASTQLPLSGIFYVHILSQHAPIDDSKIC